MLKLQNTEGFPVHLMAQASQLRFWTYQLLLQGLGQLLLPKDTQMMCVKLEHAEKCYLSSLMLELQGKLGLLSQPSACSDIIPTLMFGLLLLWLGLILGIGWL